MRRSHQSLSYHGKGALATLLLVAAAACQSASAGAKLPAPPTKAKNGEVVSLDGVEPYVIPGETMTWELSIAGLEAGRARFAAGVPGEEDESIVLQAQAEASGMVAVVRDMRDDAQSVVDRKTGLPLRTEAEAAWSGKMQRVVSTRIPGANTVVQEILRRNKDGQETTSKRTQKLPDAETHDALSAILILRGWSAPIGTRSVLYSIGGSRLWRTELVVEGQETIDTALGPRKTVRVAGTAYRMSTNLTEDNKRPPREFTMWRTDDEERLPIKITAETEFGNVTIELTSYQTPAGAP
jgi:hypothetical protein